MITISKQLKEKYNVQYSDKSEVWRKIEAIGKIKNTIELTKNPHYKVSFV